MEVSAARQLPRPDALAPQGCLQRCYTMLHDVLHDVRTPQKSEGRMQILRSCATTYHASALSQRLEVRGTYRCVGGPRWPSMLTYQCL